MLTECPAVGVGGVHSDEWYDDGRCAWCGDHGPQANDNRAAARIARAARRSASLYEGRDEGETERLRDVNSTRTSIMRWAPGENPHEDVDELHGYEDIKLEVQEDQSKTEKERFGGVKGTASHIVCFECGVNDYLIVDERTAQQVIDERPEESWAQKMNRPLDFWRAQAEYLLFCPGCHAVAQMLQAVVRRLQAQRNGGS